MLSTFSSILLKGIVFIADTPNKRFSLQIVGRRTEISELDNWGDRDPLTQIVAIGESEKIDSQGLRSMFDKCIKNYEPTNI